MSGNTAIVIGATGQVGSLLVTHLLQDPYYEKVRVLVRRAYDRLDPKLESRLVNFKHLPSLKAALGNGHAIFCCIGTTMKLVKGNKALYREIDLDIPVHSGRLGYENGIRQFVLVSAVGANPRSRNFYLRLKGEVEKELEAIPFDSLYIMRPSMLLGHRDVPRPGEGLAKVLMPPLSWLFAGKLAKYKPIPSSKVALAMIAAAKQGAKGVHVCEYPQLQSLAANL
ncbi:MAG TPA: NAD(P)H-binding protein [Puia sp.]